MVRNTVWLCRPYWKYGRMYSLLFILLGVAITPIADFIYVYFPKLVVDLLNQGKPFGQVALYAGVVLLISYALILAPIISDAYLQKKNKAIGLKIKRDIYEKALRIDYQYIDNPEYYDKYTWALDEYSDQAKAALNLVKRFFTLVASIGVLFALIASTAPWILLLDFVQLFLHAQIFKYENKVNIQYKADLVPVRRRLSYFHRIFYQKEYAADLKSSPLSKKIFGKYEIASQKDVEITETYSKKLSFYNFLHETTFCLTEFIIIIYLIHAISTGRIAEVGLYITMILAFYRIDEKLVFMLQTFSSAHELSLNSEKIQAFFAIEPKIEVEAKDGSLTSPKGPFSVEFKDAAFSYENSDFSVSGFNLSIKSGEKIAIVGENGAGKSTLVKLLLRLYDVSGGAILINGQPLPDYDIYALRKRIGVAFQTPNVYAMSYAENIALYSDLSREDLASITDHLGLTSILKKNQADFDSELTREFSEDGIMLSGGETQKIAIARIMKGDFGLLLLDEPSSALDPLSEYKMTELLLGEANKTTTILVSHRLSTVRSADKIVLVKNGKIAECGTHAQLMALEGSYCEMFTKQAEHYLA